MVNSTGRHGKLRPDGKYGENVASVLKLGGGWLKMGISWKSVKL